MSSTVLNPTDDRGNEAMAIFWMEGSLAILVMSARFYSRFQLRSISADDWWMLITLLVFLAYCGLVTSNAHMGGFKHLIYIDPSKLMQVGINNYAIQGLGIFAFGSAKLSVGYLILRLLPPAAKWRKWSVFFVIWFTFGFNMVFIFITFFQCSPPRALWNPTVPHTCWDPVAVANADYGGTAENIAVDIFLAIMPVTFIWSLNMAVKQRINLCFLLGLGFMAAICATVKITHLHELSDHDDLTWVAYPAVVWSGSEIFVIIICGSIPSLKPLWDRYVSKKRALDSVRLKDYKFGTGSSSSRGNGYSVMDKPEGGIKRTTDIDVISAERSDEDLFRGQSIA